MNTSRLFMMAVICSGIMTLNMGCSQKQAIKQVSSVGEDIERIELNQGWTDEIRQKFWFTTQGAQIIPYTWFLWLEQADSENLFRSNTHMESLRYLPEKPSSLNPGGLPIGFALDKTDEQDWMGLTCAACHTNQIDYKGKKYLVEGAPTLANFVEFFNRLAASLKATYQNESKFQRFAKNVLADNYSDSAADDLKQSVIELSLKVNERIAVNALPEHYPSDFTSYARLDAFGNIQNAASAFALHDLSNKNAPTAPVSYPFLWGTHQSDVVQWNASAPNTPVVGPLVRNIGEVVGVFGNLDMEESAWWRRLLFDVKVEYSSSVIMQNLGSLELWVKQLRAPAWSETALPSVDTMLAAQGSLLYDQHCASCHQVIPADKQADLYQAVRVPVSVAGTDPAMSVNASYHMASTLLLEGTKEQILIGKEFGAVAPSISLAVNGVTGLVLQKPLTALKAGLIPTLGGSKGNFDENTFKQKVSDYLKKRTELAEHDSVSSLSDFTPDLSKIYYKARPLNGIWATAPYLHNGSVPDLWQLLQKPDQRVKSFWVGSREFDPKHVGFVSSEGLNEFKVLQKDGQAQPGNSNSGHEHGTDLADSDKWALIEYMKTL